jgi:3-hydroxybutyryl-CoA dehydrogenase
MRKMDYTGLEMVRNGIASRSYSPPEASGTNPVLERLIEAGRTGVRAGAGFYDYGDSAPDLLFRQRDRQLLTLKRKLAEIEGD